MAVYIQIFIVVLDATQTVSLMTCWQCLYMATVYSIFVSYVLPEDGIVMPKRVRVK